MRKLALIFFVACGSLLLINPLASMAQLSAPGSVFSENTSYPMFGEQDPLFIFCDSGEGNEARLRAATALSGSKTWAWEKFNPLTGTFEFYFSENNGNTTSEIANLEDGCYRITITGGGTTEIFRAWVFNNRNSAAAEISESNCLFFTLRATPAQVPLVYYDLSTLAPVEITKNLELEWRQGDDILSSQAVRQVFDPPSKDTEYTLVVSDRFGCETTTAITYVSIVAKASFTADPMDGEAPLEVTFTSKSENADSLIWFFFRDLDEIKRDPSVPVDSILEIAFNDDAMTFPYDYSGTYMVKLTAINTKNDLHCRQTVYLEDYIMVDTSFVDVPNVFTPNGDGTNDNFVVKFWSMERVKISVFNRWGRTVHMWESGNVRGFEDTWLESVWDGRIGGRYASPGVYFYVIEGTGRDGKKRWKHGDVYLFRDKD